MHAPPTRKGLRLPRLGRAVWLLLLLALVVRLGVAAAADLHFYPQGQDPYDYDRHARSIASGDGFAESHFPKRGPSAFRPPLYPLFLGAVYAVTDSSIAAARAVQVLLGTIAVGLLGIVAWQVWGRAVALASLALGAVYLPLVITGTTLLTEALFVPLELGALAAALEHRRRGRGHGWLVSAGVLGGLAALTRTNGVLLLVPLAVAVFPPGERLSIRALRWPAVLLGTAALTIVPWTVRNAVVMDAFVPLTTETGFTLAGTYNEFSREKSDGHAVWQPPFFAPEFAPLFGREQEVALDRELRSAALEDIRDHPYYVPEVGFWNTVRFLQLTGRSDARSYAFATALDQRLVDAGAYTFYLFAPLALLGALGSAARRAPRSLWLVPLVFLSSVFVLGFVRLRAPIDPFVILLAAIAIVGLVGRLAPRSERGETSGVTRRNVLARPGDPPRE